MQSLQSTTQFMQLQGIHCLPLKKQVALSKDWQPDGHKMTILWGNRMENPKCYASNGLKRPFALQNEWSQRSIGLVEAEIWPFQVADQDYLPLKTDRPSLNQIASGTQAIGISNTVYRAIQGCPIPLHTGHVLPPGIPATCLWVRRTAGQPGDSYFENFHL